MLFKRTFAIVATSVIICQSNVWADHLLNTKWTQSSPYNKLCPTDKEGKQTPPGCGAVALGQILFFHDRNCHAYGSVDYEYTVEYGEDHSGTERITMNFDEMNINSDDILYSYPEGGYTEEQANAVSMLLLQMGAGCFMQYRSYGSSPMNNGSQLWGIHHHLRVSPDAMIHYRAHYSSDEWKAMLDNELEKGCPVYYGGGWYHYNTKGELVRVGHIFVIDGKNPDGTYSINWGNNHDGASVSLEVMNQNPKQPYIGGGAVCYHTNQYMITGLLPAKDNAKYLDQALISSRPLILNDDKSLTETILSGDDSFILQYRVENYSNSSATNIHDGIGLYKDGEDEPFLIIQNPEWRSSLGMGRYLDRRRVIKLGSLPDGNYIGRLMSENAVTGEWQRMLEGIDCTIRIAVADGKTTVTIPHNYTGEAKIYLREPIKEVDNPYGSAYPGKVLLLPISNSGTNNYQDSLKITVTTEDDNKSVELPYYMSVYQDRDMTLHYLIPKSIIDLEGRPYKVAIEYYDSYNSKYVQLGVGKDSDIDLVIPDKNETDTQITEIYNLSGVPVYKGTDAGSINLQPGIYIIRQGDKVYRRLIRN